MMKYIWGTLLVLLLTGSKWAVADRLDTLETYNTVDYCTTTTSIFMQGADAFAFKRGRNPEVIDPVEWATLNRREQEFFRVLFQEAYDAVEKIAKTKALVTEDRDTLLQTYFEGCIAKRGTKIKGELFNPLIQAASSKQITCELRARRFYEDCLQGKRECLQ